VIGRRHGRAGPGRVSFGLGKSRVRRLRREHGVRVAAACRGHRHRGSRPCRVSHPPLLLARSTRRRRGPRRRSSHLPLCCSSPPDDQARFTFHRCPVVLRVRPPRQRPKNSRSLGRLASGKGVAILASAILLGQCLCQSYRSLRDTAFLTSLGGQSGLISMLWQNVHDAPLLQS
jgi:hypothetical protein